jgi:hypothetical protein
MVMVMVMDGDGDDEDDGGLIEGESGHDDLRG